MTKTVHKRRTKPARTGPIRNAPSGEASQTRKATVATSGAEPGLDVAVSDAVAQAVRLGYQVLAQNLEEGRTAAKQFRVGEYNVRNAPSDLNHLALRMVGLSRDLSTTTFDLLDRVLQDPALMKAVQRIAAEPAPTQSGSKAKAASQPSKAAQSKPKSAAEPPAPFVPITCTFSGPARATVLAAWLARPPSAATLASPGLTTLDAKAPAITGIAFGPSADGSGVVAAVTIPARQPAGVYSGAVVSAESGVALGTLTIQVAA
jgi:hypothetical protein